MFPSIEAANKILTTVTLATFNMGLSADVTVHTATKDWSIVDRMPVSDDMQVALDSPNVIGSPRLTFFQIKVGQTTISFRTINKDTLRVNFVGDGNAQVIDYRTHDKPTLESAVEHVVQYIEGLMGDIDVDTFREECDEYERNAVYAEAS